MPPAGPKRSNIANIFFCLCLLDLIYRKAEEEYPRSLRRKRIAPQSRTKQVMFNKLSYGREKKKEKEKSDEGAKAMSLCTTFPTVRLGKNNPYRRTCCSFWP